MSTVLSIPVAKKSSRHRPPLGRAQRSVPIPAFALRPDPVVAGPQILEAIPFSSVAGVFLLMSLSPLGAIWRLFPWRRTYRYIVVAVASLNRRSRIAQRQDFDHQNPAQVRVDRDRDHHGDDCREGAPPHRRGKGRNHQDHPTILRHPVFTNMLTTPSSDLLTQFE